jgi:pimeloyl-ACP methyl ester carboxylesterase
LASFIARHDRIDKGLGETMAEQTVAKAAGSPHFTEPSVVDVRGLQVAYRRKGSGRPTVFLHGAGSTRMWLPFYERMSASVDFLAPEHPGFGDTPAPDWLEGFDDLVLHYRDLLDVLGLDQVHMIGFSLGGWIAAEFALFYPERLKTLTLITPAGLLVPGVPMVDLMRMPPEKIPDLLYNGRTQDYLEFLPDPHDPDAAVRGYREASTLARLMWNPRYDRKLDRRLERITCPALVVEPDEDRLIPAAACGRWVELLPRAQLVKVRGEKNQTGHGLIMQEPERAADVILGFIQEADR